MDLQEFVRILRNRWRIVTAITAATTLAAIVYSVLSPSIYASTAQLFVSTSSNQSAGELYQGGRFSQERVSSYRQLIMGDALAERAIDSLDLNVGPEYFHNRVLATSAPETVLIDITVRDTDPVLARDIANALAAEFIGMVAELETVTEGTPPPAQVAIVEQAAISENPIAPKRLANIALGFVVGLLIGVGLAIIRDRLDNTIKDRHTLEEVGEIALVGTIPYEKDRVKYPAINFSDTRSAGAEAYRSLRTNLQFLNIDNAPKVITITSCLPGEGKTTSAANIALVLAEAGHTVCLLEGDLRRPRVTKYLGLVQEVGLTTVLAGQATVEEVLQPTSVPGVFVIGSGSIPPNPSELLSSAHARQVIEELREQFDYVVIDAPPLLPVSDSAVLAKMSDGALMVVRHGKTKREELRRALLDLDKVGATILGTVLTMISHNAASGYEYSYYYESDTSLPQQSRAYKVANARSRGAEG
ncbi:polysaccharide biosynthesis tyrosine autokinase [Hoyosella rhizosphaerae]|uniref:non-specific protein-tyrosine kinase n=1 Tax=Hoyosella rhizosphaerae TaxID=1755582 RepID=A0A916UC62_9ACTN|nr:polysaccharide biosynthesis tyrosine autokinase [Hoyosella rhizosphaerae]MBN4925885.1 polysaccharide biosynthesis tyrosine autokinase [Hoyosella rhizosphaerae]GGC67191.1 chromosome partitioning protein [Hoyosella rhizosphaerae]